MRKKSDEEVNRNPRTPDRFDLMPPMTRDEEIAICAHHLATASPENPCRRYFARRLDEIKGDRPRGSSLAASPGADRRNRT